ncbi:HNH endonuclease [Rhodophyticola sp.]|uniref:HNH endonuclease signature motif containing protein n=1 Tax=Rhodophyticola sp. TaxID=2680032 RepID=UPI003D2A5936
MTSQPRFVGAFEMAANEVYLDALIPREDFATLSGLSAGSSMSSISLSTLSDDFFVSSLRKPDFQRETANWNPQKIVDLVEAFLDGDLVPAVILWRSGQFVFVIDGAHRISAMLAWVYDDYGDKRRSREFLENQVPVEQVEIAEKTRSLMNERVGSYSSYKEAAKSPAYADEKIKNRLGALASNSFVVQWVPAENAEGAEKSFFKINQAPTPVNPIEKRILRSRSSANAISTRAINRSGSGHKYWGHFDAATQREIESFGRSINDILYKPSLSGSVIKTADVPIGGKGYSTLPFLFEFVNVVNEISPKTRKDPEDPDGEETLEMLRRVQDSLELISTDKPKSLGLHPLVYFYTRGGQFQPNAFLAVIQFVKNLEKDKKLDDFTRVRRNFEDFLLGHKEAFTLLVKNLGSGARSRPAIEKFLKYVFDQLASGKTTPEILSGAAAESEQFSFLSSPAPSRGTGRRKTFSSGTKSFAYVKELQKNGVRCGICGGLIHSNSIGVDHIKRKRDDGDARPSNAQVSHPFCNSGYKS